MDRPHVDSRLGRATRFSPVGLLLVGVLLLVGCWPSPKDEVSEKMSRARLKISAIRDNAIAEDRDAQALLEQASEAMLEAEKHLTEEDHFQAVAVLDDLIFRLDNYLRFGTDAQGSSDIQVFGNNATWRDASGKEQPFTGAEKADDIFGVKAGFRSAVHMAVSDGLSVQLGSESEMRLERRKKNTVVTLVGGALQAVGSQAGTTTLVEDRFSAEFQGPFEAELAKNTVSGTGYLSVKSGKGSWVYADQRDTLGPLTAVSWSGDQVATLDVPSAPRIEHPENHSTQHLTDGEAAEVEFRWYTQLYNTNFQLQVSAEKHFATRIYDNPGLSDSAQAVPLKAGEYYWRVRGFNQDDNGLKVPGPFTKTMVVYVSGSGLASDEGVQEEPARGPKPVVTGVTFKSIGTSIIATGRTAPTNRVKINGVSAIVGEDGQFSAVIETPAGLQIIRLVVVNPETGATTVQEHKVKI